MVPVIFPEKVMKMQIHENLRELEKAGTKYGLGGFYLLLHRSNKFNENSPGPDKTNKLINPRQRKHNLLGGGDECKETITVVL